MIAMILCLALIIAFPSIATFLPGYMSVSVPSGDLEA